MALGGERQSLDQTSQMDVTEMKLAVALVIVSLCSSSALAQQQVGSSALSSGAATGQQGQSPPLSFPPPSARIRVIGSPAVQPVRGLGVECTPVEQGIAGVIIGPTDLCDR
jgi:hypothetical protein